MNRVEGLLALISNLNDVQCDINNELIVIKKNYKALLISRNDINNIRSNAQDVLKSLKDETITTIVQGSDIFTAENYLNDPMYMVSLLTILQQYGTQQVTQTDLARKLQMNKTQFRLLLAILEEKQYIGRYGSVLKVGNTSHIANELYKLNNIINKKTLYDDQPTTTTTNQKSKSTINNKTTKKSKRKSKKENTMDDIIQEVLDY